MWSTLVLSALITLSGNASPHQQPAHEHHAQPAADAVQQAESAAVHSFADLAFMAGSWRGEADGQIHEEHWSPAAGNNMLGMFRWVGRDGGIRLMELLCITKEGDEFLLRLRHFRPGMIAWADEDQPSPLKLVEVAPNRALFRATDENASPHEIGFERSGHGLTISVIFNDGRAPLTFPLQNTAPHAEALPLRGLAAAEAWDRLKTLEGRWKGKSTKGWEDEGTYRLVAGGSVLVHESFGAHSNETMFTMFTPDEDRLTLTHYCVAKNQPRLVLSRTSKDGSELEFTFLDAGNLPSRSKGHMDKMRLRSDGPDRFTTRWTWYQDGQESWMEEIVHERVLSETRP